MRRNWYQPRTVELLSKRFEWLAGNDIASYPKGLIVVLSSVAPGRYRSHFVAGILIVSVSPFGSSYRDASYQLFPGQS